MTGEIIAAIATWLAVVVFIAHDLRHDIQPRGQERSYEEKKAFRECLTMGAIFLTAAAALVQARLFQISMEDARGFANTQHADTLAAIDRAKTANDEAARIAVATEKAASDAIRPIVWFTNDIVKPDYSVQRQRIEWNLRYTNFGKGVASNVKIAWCLEVRIDGTRRRCSLPGLVAPIPPNQIDLFTAVSTEPITKDEMGQVQNTDLSIQVTGSITYADAYGKIYETTFCLAPLADGRVSYCTGNDIK